MSTPRDEFELFVGFLQDFLYVQTLDCGVAVFDEEGVGLPSGGAGAAVCRCEVVEGT